MGSSSCGSGSFELLLLESILVEIECQSAIILGGHLLQSNRNTAKLYANNRDSFMGAEL